MSKAPGPGAYSFLDPEEMITMKASKKACIGNATREGTSFYDGQQRKNPGPSDYKIPSIFGASKKTMAVMMEDFSKTRKIKNIRINNPGVGQYDVIASMDFAMTKMPSFQIGKSHRESINKTLISLPGPGQY